MILWALAFSTSFAGTESVTVIKVLDDDDKGIIERRNGERWLIEKGVGALSFWRFEGKQVLIQSPGLFCGVGSKIILPNVGQEAHIWNAEHIAFGGTNPAASSAVSDIELTVRALTLLGYYSPTSRYKSKRDPVRALNEFQKKNRLKQTTKLSSATQLALSVAVSSRKPVTKETLTLASLLLGSAKKLRAGVQLSSEKIRVGNTGVGTIEAQVDGDFNGWEGQTIVKLMNGEIWQQTEFHYHYHYAFMPKVVIVKSGIGHKMIVDGVPKAIGVKRLK